MNKNIILPLTFVVICLLCSCNSNNKKPIQQKTTAQKSQDAPIQENNTLEFENLIAKGQENLKNMQLELAVENFYKATLLKPDSVIGYYGIGVAKAILCHQSGIQCYEAIEMMKKTLEIEPNYRKANFNIGTCYAKLGKYNDALSFLNQAISADNTNGEYLLNRGFVKLQLNNKAGACNDFELAHKYGAANAKDYLLKCK